MAFNKFTNLDYDQIRESIKDYLRANSDFTGFDFDGSNFSVLIDTLAYNAYINSVNANMIVNESFLDSATLRRNVVSLAGNIGYLPRSAQAATAKVTFTADTNVETPTLTLRAGLVATGVEAGTSYLFSSPEDITATVVDGVAQFGTEKNPITMYQGTYAQTTFKYDGSQDQRFIISNPGIDYSTLVVSIKDENDVGRGQKWTRVSNIVNINSLSEVYFLTEVENEYYELIFGDGIFGKQLQTGQTVVATYIITDGKDGDGPRNFSFAGSLVNSNGAVTVPTNNISLNTLESARNGADIENLDSIKYFAPRVYGAQYRAVTARDYEAIIKQIYQNTESVSVIGGEELDPPQFGNVLISIKPVNGLEISEFDKRNILDGLKQYTIAGISQKLVDLKVLYIEVDTSVYYDVTKVGEVSTLESKVVNSLDTYANSVDLSKFGGRFKYSKTQRIIDDTDVAITSNITNVIIRRNLSAVTNKFVQYELCYGNAFFARASGANIKSSGFNITGFNRTVYITDTPEKDTAGNLTGTGIISFITENVNSSGGVQYRTVVENAGTVDYSKGEIQLFTTNISGTELENNVIEIQAVPLSNDVIGLKDLYVSFDVSKSTINMVRDTISSGEQISGVNFPVSPSYSNGKLTR